MIASRRPSPDQLLASALDAADAVHARLLAHIRDRYGAAALGVIDLPDLGTPSGSAAQLEVVATMYQLREIERAGVLVVVEALATGFGSGDFMPPAGRSLAPLFRFWRSARNRFSRAEREAQYARLLDDVESPTDGSGDLTELMRTLAAYRREPAAPAALQHAARAMALAEGLRTRLAPRSAGITAFAAREITSQVREAWALLGHPDVLRAVGGARTAADILVRLAPGILGVPVQPAQHIQRGSAGARVLSWVVSQRPLRRTDPVLSAAETWLANTMASA